MVPKVPKKKQGFYVLGEGGGGWSDHVLQMYN